MSQPLSIAIIDTDTRVRNDLREIIGSLGDIGIVAATADFEEGINCIRESRPQVVILEVREMGQGTRQMSQILSHCPQTSVFVSCAEKNPDWILGLMRAGAREYLSRPAVAKELIDALNKVSRLQSPTGVQPGVKGKAIAVYNPSAGMGTTTIAVNIAAALAARGESVALVDLNLFSGDVAAFLDLAPRYTLAHVTAKVGQLDANFIRSVMAQHSCGVHVLAGPLDLGDADRVKPEQVRDVIALLKTLFPYTIVDAGGQLYGTNLALFKCCDRILFNTVLNLPNLKNAQRYLTAMHNEGFGPDKVKLVVNRSVARDEIKTSDAERVLNTKALAAIPNAYAEVKAAINKGEPLVISSPRSPAARAITELAATLPREGVKDKEAIKGGTHHAIFRAFSF